VRFAAAILSLLCLASVAAARVLPGGERPPATAGAVCGGEAATIRGSSADDELKGTPRRDVIVAFRGDDEISGRGGGDLICAGGGDDQLEGGNGNDLLNGGAGEDHCNGGPGRNTITACEGTPPRRAAKIPTDQPPVASADSAALSEGADATAIEVLANDTDIDGGPKSVTGVGGPAHGIAGIVADGSVVTYQSAPDYCGPDSFTYTLNGGSSATVSVTVLCSDDRPTAVDDSADLTEDDPPTPVPVLANDADIDGGPISISAKTNGAHGPVAITGGGSGLTYMPTGDFCGPDSFTYTVNGGSTATVSVVVDCVDDMPLAVADVATLAEDAPATPIPVLANDTDIDAGPKLVASKTNGAHGTVEITNGGGGLTYHPALNYCGPDSFTYTLNGGSKTTVAVTVSCVDDLPVAVNDSAGLTEDDPATAIPVLANDTDVDAGPKSIESKTDGAHGSVEITGGGTGLTYAPTGNHCGADSFTYTLNGGSSATVSVAVSCVDDAPVAVNDSAAFTEDDSATAISVLTNDTDIDVGPKSIESVTQPADGAVVITGGGAGLTYEPDDEYCTDLSPPISFEYTLNGGSSATVSVTVACFEEGSPVVSLSTVPTLTPSFDRSVDDYYLRCTGAPVEVSANVGPGYTVSVDGKAPQSGSTEAAVALQGGQEFQVVVQRGDGQHRYHVRCLPPDFSPWTFTRLSKPSHEFYVVAPTLGAGASKYVVVVNDQGVPVWWYKPTGTAADAKVLPDGTVAWTQTGPNNAEIRNLDGSLGRVITTVGTTTDNHEILSLPNGNVILMSYRPRPEPVDLTAFGGDESETVIDGVIQEINPEGDVVWEWSTEGHIALAETGRWYSMGVYDHPLGADIVHMNAFEPDGPDSFLISLRHTDAVYKIDKATGDVVWKLGGTVTPESLAVLDDPQVYTLGGQHDARVQPDGTITVYDNRTGLAGLPRAVRYEVDQNAHTARLLEEVTDPEVPASFCCGSARRSADGSWLMSWGGRSLVTEFDSAGSRAFKLTFGGSRFSYRAIPAPDGVVTIDALRAGMNAMFPR
jgi:hypothetical protein